MSAADFSELCLCVCSMLVWGRFALLSIKFRHQSMPHGSLVSKLRIFMPAMACLMAVILIAAFELLGQPHSIVVLLVMGILAPLYGASYYQAKLAEAR